MGRVRATRRGTGVMERIHIVGVSPRTGTTLLAETMVACLDIDGHEAHEAPLTRLRSGRRVYLTKRPMDLFVVQPRLRFDRHFHAICLMRDPRDVVVSRHRNDASRYWVPLSVWKERFPVVCRLRGHERFLLVRYEDLVSDPDLVQLELLSRLPFLERHHAFSAFHQVATPSRASLRALGGLRQIDRASVGAWRDHLPRVAGQLALHGSVTGELIELGYETDATWLSTLESVEPDLSPSRLGKRGRRGWRRRWLPIAAWLSTGVVLASRLGGLRVA